MWEGKSTFSSLRWSRVVFFWIYTEWHMDLRFMVSNLLHQYMWWCSMLRIQCCCSCGAGLIPGLGTSTCHRCGKNICVCMCTFYKMWMCTHTHVCIWWCLSEERWDSFAECPHMVLGGDEALVELFHLIFLCPPYNFRHFLKWGVRWASKFTLYFC